MIPNLSKYLQGYLISKIVKFWIWYFFLQIRSQKPVEHCNLEPYESCNQVAKQYPYLEENEQCIEVPSENCVPNRIKPQLITRPIIKKSCTKMPEELFVSETMISELSVNRYGK